MQNTERKRLWAFCTKTAVRFSVLVILLFSLQVPVAADEVPYYEGVVLADATHPTTNEILLTYDTVRRRVIMVTPTDPGETWIWNGTNWINTDMETPSHAASLTFDTHRGVAVLYRPVASLEPGETWEWDGGVGGWQLVNTQGPTSRFWCGTAYDERRHVTVLYGGHYTYEGPQPAWTWEWDGAHWKVFDTSGQGQSRAAQCYMAYDAKHGVIVMWDEYTTATWDGHSWQVFPDDGLEMMGQPGLTYDRRRQSVILFGGVTQDWASNQIWEWDGDLHTWHQLESSPQLGNRFRLGMAYDTDRSEIVMYGGYRQVPSGDLWRVYPLYDTALLRVRKIWVDYSYYGPETGGFDTPFNSLGEAVDATSPKGIIALKPGTGQESIVITKPVWLKAPLGPAVIQ